MNFYGVAFSDCFSLLAIIISVCGFFYSMYVNFPRMRVFANVETLTEFETDGDGNVYSSKGDTILWITISNHSSRRIFVTELTSYWSWSLNPFRWKKIALDGLFRSDQEKQEPVTSFWVEPWGVVALGKIIDGNFEEDFEYKLKKKFTDPRNRLLHFALNYRVVAFDGQEKQYKSNKIKIINPSIINKNFWQILKIIFSKKK
jgi:hypothetical protein